MLSPPYLFFVDNDISLSGNINNAIYRYYSRFVVMERKLLKSDCPAPFCGGAGLIVVTNSIGVDCLEHPGDLAQCPASQETQRHGFSCPVAAHHPLEISRLCHWLAFSRDHDIQPLELSMICRPTGADLSSSMPNCWVRCSRCRRAGSSGTRIPPTPSEIPAGGASRLA